MGAEEVQDEESHYTSLVVFGRRQRYEIFYCCQHG